MSINVSQIHLNLDTNKPNLKIDDKFLQGNTDKTLNIKFLKNSDSITISDGIKAIITLVFYNGSTVYKKYLISPTKTDGTANSSYTIPPITDNTLVIPFSSDIAFTDHAGRTDLIINIKDGTSFYTYSLTYNVDKNEAYSSSGVIDNLPNIDKIVADVSDIKTGLEQAKVAIVNEVQTVNTKANLDLSNVGEFAAAADGTLLYKKDGKLKGTPLVIDDANKLIKSPYSLRIPPNTLELGNNIKLKENGGFIEFKSNASGKEYLLLDYENDPTTGTQRPVYYERGALSQKVSIQGNDTQVMNNVTSIALGKASENYQVQAIYLNFISAVNNFKIKLLVNNVAVAFYPSEAAWNGQESGYNLQAGLQKISINPFWTTLDIYNSRVLEIKADSQINLKGNGTLPYIALDLNYITKKNIALSDEIPSVINETGATIRDKLQALNGTDRLSATAIKDLPSSLQVAIQQGDTPITPTKLLFPFANGLVNDSGIVTVNTSFVVTDENNEIVPDCSIIEVPSTSLISATQNQGNSNAVTLDFKGVNVDSGATTPVLQSKYLRFPQATVVNDGSATSINTAPLVSVDGTLLNERVEIFEFPSTGGLAIEDVAGTDTVKVTAKGIKATTDDNLIMEGFKNIDFPDTGLLIGEEDPADSNKLLVSFGGLPVKKLNSSTSRKATELHFPQASVFGADGGVVTVSTGHSVSQGDNEINAQVNTWIIPDDGGLSVESDPNNNNAIILKNTILDNGVSVTNDDTQAVNQTKFTYFPQARIYDGSVVGSKVIKTSTPIKNGTDNFDDYNKINFENNDFIVTRDSNDNNMLDVKFNGLSVESGGSETPAVKVFSFNNNDFNVTSSQSNLVDINLNNKTKNGFLAVYNHRQVIASANAQEIYRTTTLVPNHVIWKDDSILYDSNTGLITLKYDGTNGEKQLFKLIARATVRRQIRETDLGVYLYFADNSNGEYITDVNGETPIVNNTISKDLVSDFVEISTMIAITQDTVIKAVLKDDTPNKFIDVLDLAMGTSAIMVEKVNEFNQPSNALINYEILTQQSMRFIKHEFTESFENAKALINNTPNSNVSVTDGTNLQQDGWIINFQEEGTYKQNTTPDGNGICFEMDDKLAGFGYFNITRVLDYEDTWALRGHEVIAKVDIVEQTGDFEIVPVVWRRKINQYPMIIISNMNNQGLYSTTDGWETIAASKTSIAAPTPAETTASFTCTYTVPDDAVNIGFMLMPTKQQTRSIIKFTDFSIGCNPTFERWIIRYPEQAVEGQLKKDSKYIKFLPESTTAYNMNQWYQIPNGTAGDNNYSPLYTGEAQSGGNADITRIYDSSSTDFETLHNKGKFRFGKDGRVTVHSKVYVGTDKFADGSDHTSFRLGYIKDSGDGNILNGTPVTASLRELQINKAGNVWTDAVRTGAFANWTFTMDVKENDEYWIACNPIGVPRATGNEGHIYSYPNGMIEFTFLENEYAINLLQQQIINLASLLKATPEAISQKAFIELGYDAANSKPTLEAKLDTTI